MRREVPSIMRRALAHPYAWLMPLPMVTASAPPRVRAVAGRVTSVLFMIAMLSGTALAQSTNYRAQARYYSAKEAYDRAQYSTAAGLLLQSRQLLSGKSNERLQFLLVVSLYRAGQYTDAQKETARFFDIVEGRETQASYTKDVDHVSQDEVREITMLVDKIDNAVVASAANAVHAADEARRAAENARIFADLSGNYLVYGPGIKGAAAVVTESGGGFYGSVNDGVAFDGSRTSESMTEIRFAGTVNYYVPCPDGTSGNTPLFDSVTIVFTKSTRTFEFTVANAQYDRFCMEAGRYGSRTYRVVRR